MSAPSHARRRLLRAAVGAAVCGVAAGRFALAQGQGEAKREGRLIEVTAQRFKFIPAEIAVRHGETVTLALTALDFPHGFSVPELQLRADLVPGRVVKLTLTPPRAGRLAFLCDNFCGDGHEGMHGVLVVG
jgi:cytochrome c oxidase subunit 2